MVKDINKATSEIKSWFPHIQSDTKFVPTSECTRRYNCIAWAMRFTDRWVQPSKGERFWWPKYNKGLYDMSREGLIEAFKHLGFTVCDNDKMEPFYDKVALYYNTSTNTWTHAARIVGTSEYHSKAGEGWDFHHDNNPKRLHDPRKDYYSRINSYGVVYKIMKRHKIKRLYSYYHIAKRLLLKILYDPLFTVKYIVQFVKDIIVLVSH